MSSGCFAAVSDVPRPTRVVHGRCGGDGGADWCCVEVPRCVQGTMSTIYEHIYEQHRTHLAQFAHGAERVGANVPKWNLAPHLVFGLLSPTSSLDFFRPPRLWTSFAHLVFGLLSPTSSLDLQDFTSMGLSPLKNQNHCCVVHESEGRQRARGQGQPDHPGRARPADPAGLVSWRPLRPAPHVETAHQRHRGPNQSAI